MVFWKLRIDQLEPKERFVNSAMDEVYTTQSVYFLVAEFSTIISKIFAVSLNSMYPGMFSAKWRRGYGRVIIECAAAAAAARKYREAPLPRPWRTRVPGGVIITGASKADARDVQRKLAG